MDEIFAKEVITRLTSTIEQIISVNDITANLGCVDGVIIGTGRSDFTQDSTMYNLLIGEKKFAMIDIPGIEGDESAFEAVIKKSLEQAHVIFYVNGSGKKIEKESLEKIKRYMHDGTSVYAVFNTHCKAKKARVPGIDKLYSEELEVAYAKQGEIIKQTEEELQSFLGKNFKGSVSLNGLLAFCSVAFNANQKSSIKEEADKSLRTDQKKYLKEYNDNIDQMVEDSHLLALCETIEKKVESFDTEILAENVKKLQNRMNEMLEKITILKSREYRKIDGFINTYLEFEDNCYNAKEDFIRTMRHVAFNAATDAFYDLMNEIFDRIEQDEGKTKAETIEAIVSKRRGDIVETIQIGVNEKIAKAQDAFKQAIEDAQERMKRDFEREQVQFEISLTSDSVMIDSSFADALKYNIKDFGKHAFTVGSLALSGAGVGSLICPGLGTAIGAGVGAVLGVLSSIWNYFVSAEKRINNAKAKIQQAIDEQIDELSDQINGELRKMNYEERINEIYDSICLEVEKQKETLLGIKKMIGNVENEMLEVSKKIA